MRIPSLDLRSYFYKLSRKRKTIGKLKWDLHFEKKFNSGKTVDMCGWVSAPLLGVVHERPKCGRKEKSKLAKNDFHFGILLDKKSI